MEVSIQPLPQTDRISSLDFLRGIAVLGILLINIESFAYPEPWSPYKYGFTSKTDEWSRFWVYFLAQGKFFGMFTLLFGAGFYIFLERLDQKNMGLRALDLYARRLLWLFTFGVIHAYFIWDGDILYHYAVCGFFLFPFRSISIGQLWLVIGLLMLVLLYNSYERTGALQKQQTAFLVAEEKDESVRTAEDKKAIQRWVSKTSRKYSDTTNIKSKRSTFWQNIVVNAEHTKVHKGVIFYKGILFRTLIMMILGIILYKLDVFRDYSNIRWYWPITLVILAAALAINYFRYYHWTFQYFHPITEVWKGWLFTFPKEILALAYVLLFNGLYQKFFNGLWLKPIICAGRMALSNYIFQSVACGLIFYGFTLNQFNQFSRHELLYFVAGIWVIQLVLSLLWLKKFDQGPLEAFWRKLTYRRTNL